MLETATVILIVAVLVLAVMHYTTHRDVARAIVACERAAVGAERAAEGAVRAAEAAQAIAAAIRGWIAQQGASETPAE